MFSRTYSTAARRDASRPSLADCRGPRCRCRTLSPRHRRPRPPWPRSRRLVGAPGLELLSERFPDGIDRVPVPQRRGEPRRLAHHLGRDLSGVVLRGRSIAGCMVRTNRASDSCGRGGARSGRCVFSNHSSISRLPRRRTGDRGSQPGVLPPGGQILGHRLDLLRTCAERLADDVVRVSSTSRVRGQRSTGSAGPARRALW